VHLLFRVLGLLMRPKSYHPLDEGGAFYMIIK